jgi:hypothetical protein
MSRVIDNKYDFGEIVYLKTDKEQSPRIVYCFKVYQNEILYELACGTQTSSHYEYEISKEPNVILATTN